jgi:glycosyltransferase involved in cell wall biosynthesis
MRIGIVVPPFIAVPPQRYGGTELFVAHLARGLHARGHDVIVYANGDSRVDCSLKWRYPHADWPPADPLAAQLKNADHTAWAIEDAAGSVDVLHLNDSAGVPMTRFIDTPTVLTIHHPHEPALTDLYVKYPHIEYVAISQWQANREPMPKVRVIHHGVRLADHPFRAVKGDYVAFLGRIAPIKGAHVAIEAARRAGVQLRLAGEVQPVFQRYWEEEIAPHVDGKQVVYVGEVDLIKKNDLLGGARALLFPIQWHEPFGLVMIEAMACGTPVLAFEGGSVREIVRDGINGWICRDAADMAQRIVARDIAPASCRECTTAHFSADHMVDAYVDIYENALTHSGAAA